MSEQSRGARLPRVGAEQRGAEARGREVGDHGRQVFARSDGVAAAAAAAVHPGLRCLECRLEALQHVQLLVQPALQQCNNIFSRCG